MGLIEKQLTKRLARPSVATTTVAPDDVGQIAREFVQTRGSVGVIWRGEYEFSGEHPGPWKIRYVGGLGRSWEAVLTVRQAAGSNESIMTLQLVEWLSYDDSVKDAARFKEFRSHLLEELERRDPSLREVELVDGSQPISTRDMARESRAQSRIEAAHGRRAQVSKVDPADRSELFTPSFAVLKTTSSTAPGCYEPLDAHWESLPWPVAAEHETVLGRLQVFTALANGMVDEWGLPTTGSSGGPFEKKELFEGSGSVLITDQRIFGLLLRGQCIHGNVDADLGRFILVSVPYANIREVGLHRVKKRTGLKIRHLYLWLVPVGAMRLNFRNRLDENGVPKKVRYSDVLNEITTAASNRLLRSPTGEARGPLEQAQSLEPEPDGDHLRVVLQPHR